MIILSIFPYLCIIILFTFYIEFTYFQIKFAHSYVIFDVSSNKIPYRLAENIGVTGGAFAELSSKYPLQRTCISRTFHLEARINASFRFPPDNIAFRCADFLLPARLSSRITSHLSPDLAARAHTSTTRKPFHSQPRHLSFVYRAHSRRISPLPSPEHTRSRPIGSLSLALFPGDACRGLIGARAPGREIPFAACECRYDFAWEFAIYPPARYNAEATELRVCVYVCWPCHDPASLPFSLFPSFALLPGELRAAC